MNPSRRLFLASASVIAGTAMLTKRIGPFALAGRSKQTANGSNNTLTIFHSNGINGNMGPVYKNAGGLDQINAQLKNEPGTRLLLDAGNFLADGNNPDKQKQLINAMNGAGYIAAGLSGIDFSDGGGLITAIAQQAQFSLLNCNHHFSPAAKSLIKPYCVLKNGPVKIGVTAVCAPLKGAIYKDAITCASRTARFMKEIEGCHVVVCLSDLGPAKPEGGLSDGGLAKASAHIDMIIGNDHGKLLNNSAVFHNKLKHEVVFSAAISKGLTMGKIVINFNDYKEKQGISLHNVAPWKPAGSSLADGLRGLTLSPGPSLLS
jgi:5'-nucleotidase